MEPLTGKSQIDPRSVAPEEVERWVRRFVADAADLPLSDISLDSDVFRDLMIDSLGFVGIFAELAFAFGTPEPKDEEAYLALNTPRKIAAYVMATPRAENEA